MTMGWYGTTRCSSSSPAFTSDSYSAGLSSRSSSTDMRPVKITVSIGNFSGRRCVLKKWTVKMKPVASSASSLWMMVATLSAQPGRKRVTNTGNQRARPVPPITTMPQKTPM